MDGEKPSVLNRRVVVFTIGTGMFFGACTMAAGAFWWWKSNQNISVEVIEAGVNEAGKMVLVDVGGAVEKPGVYELKSGDRIKDALLLAGGLSANADREYVEKIINLAQTVSDGDKLYIPIANAIENDKAQVSNVKESKSGYININSAGVEELNKLIGVGDTRAAAVVAGRPYQKKEDLVSRKIIPASVYEKIKDKISVY
jgi:competence protein ComEA